MRRRTLALWIAAPLAAAAIACGASALGRDASVPLPPIVPGALVESVVDAPSPDADLARRIALFGVRLKEFKSVEALLWPTPPPPPRALVALTRRAPLAGVAPGRTDAECLAQAVYYEARSESAEGQAAVARVVLNRRASGLYPRSVCGVVFQGAARRGCQFSFACDGSMRGPRRDPASWTRAQTVAAAALTSTPAGDEALAPALNYHADYVRPRWAGALARVATIGRHIFYRATGGHPPPGGLPQLERPGPEPLAAPADAATRVED